MNKSNLDFDPFDKQLCLSEIFEVNYPREKFNQLTTALPLLFVFSSEVFNSGIKSCFGGVVSQVAVYEECFI